MVPIGTFIGFITALVIGIAVTKDAFKRYSDNLTPVLWGISVVLLMIAFLPAYLIVRPKRNKKNRRR